jgi:uncharacterized protein
MNNSFGIYPNSLDLIINELNQLKEIERAVIFGSRAMGNYKKGSDIDIAIFGRNITLAAISKLNNHLNQELPIPYFIDILHYNSLTNQELKQHIDSYGIEIFKQI